MSYLIEELIELPQDIIYLATNFTHYVKFDQQFYYTLGSIAFNPIFWNIAARLEYNTRILTKLSFGSPKLGCYVLAITIFSLGIYRDHVYQQLLLNQPTYLPFEESLIIKGLAGIVFGFGNILVLTSMYALGITGTYLGDYFGILMTERVTGFPFNINDNPMYNGSTLCFLGTALWYGKPIGIVISLFVYVMYKIALLFEEPFTAKIYAARDEELASKNV
ncbi:methylene-fatty-acyl-phospholipid synthase [Scheffersomyces coipomensis]|uniref:methylene-fatty-acyl-phospholipid synthase n=1 Tax=Scheffersomyces coipomensis TaxID=1788519 RepID=UPI00315DB966